MRVLASTFGDAASGGGLFAVQGSEVECLDDVSSTGLAYDGRFLARALRCAPDAARMSELVVSDERGVRRYTRLDDAGAVHDIGWDGEELAVVSTWHNAVRWFSPDGVLTREVAFPGPVDSCHLNGLTRRDGRFYATMFGPYGRFRGWASPAHRARSGRIFELESGRVVVDGLSAPHSPLWDDGLWLVCNSEERSVLAVDEGSRRVVQRVDCGDWTRGLAADRDFIYVGVGHRRRGADQVQQNAHVAVIDRRDWTIVERICLPVQEVFALAVVPDALVGGLRIGFATNPTRVAEARQLARLAELGVAQPAKLWPTGDPLPWSEFRGTVHCDAPPRSCTAGEMLTLTVRVTNRSRAFFTSAAPAPVFISYKWLDPATGNYVTDVRAYRSRLPRTIFPGETVEGEAIVIAPEAGAFALRLTLVQEGVTWFDEQDAGSGSDYRVTVNPQQARTEGDFVPAVRAFRSAAPAAPQCA